MSVDVLLASLDPRGRDFERLCGWVLENAPEYRSKVTRVWLWNEWPGRWGADAGIDLVAETEEGLWAVQAKHYDPAYAIRKADLDSFLSESSRAQFSYRLLVATTDHLGPTARRTLAAQEKPVGMLLRSQFAALELEWPTSVKRLRPAQPKRKRPRPHQRRAISDCLRGLGGADRGQLVMACGTGKTLVGSFLAEQIAAKRVLVLVPSLSLLGQTLREWATAVEFDYLAVCSDTTVTKDERDAVVASTTELGIPVTTDPERIARFLRRRGNAMKVVFSTYQSSPQITAAQASRVPAFDLVIADEAHRCAGPQAGVFATVLDTTKVKARRRLFMTATPRYFTGRVKKEAQESDWEIASMDEEEKFGTVLHRLSFAQAIDQDLLSDYQVVVVGVTDRQAQELAERGAFVTRDGETVTDARTLARQIGLLRSMAKHDLHRVVTFHSRIAGASRFASSLLDTNGWLPARRRPKGALWTDHVSGLMSAGERDARLRRLKAVGGDERGVLTNARCLNEGVDVPTLDGVAFIDPRRSQVDVVQAVGRAIRKAEDKTVGTIVIPVLVDKNTNPEDALESSEFDRVWQIVRALRDHDEDLAEQLDELRRGLGLRGTLGRRPARLALDMPAEVGIRFAHAFDAKVVESSTASWEFWYGLLEEFTRREGHARPISTRLERGFRLGRWVVKQRAKHSQGSLLPERVTRLETFPGWVWGVQEADWQLMYDVLLRLSEREGHGSPLQTHVEDGLPLGVWVAVQRNFRRRGQLSRERQQLLCRIPSWTWEPRDARFERNFAALTQYVRTHGKPPPPRALFGNVPVGHFADKQRQRHRRGSLRRERAVRFEALQGWDWSPWASSFDEMLALYEDYVASRGTPVVRSTEHRGRKLGVWVESQRGLRRSGMLVPDRERRLSELPNWSWDPHESAWMIRYDALLRFAQREGHARVLQSHVEDGAQLGVWVNAQRQKRRHHRLPLSRIARLEALPGWTWDARKKA